MNRFSEIPWFGSSIRTGLPFFILKSFFFIENPRFRTVSINSDTSVFGRHSTLTHQKPSRFFSNRRPLFGLWHLTDRHHLSGLRRLSVVSSLFCRFLLLLLFIFKWRQRKAKHRSPRGRFRLSAATPPMTTTPTARSSSTSSMRKLWKPTERDLPTEGSSPAEE